MSEFTSSHHKYFILYLNIGRFFVQKKQQKKNTKKKKKKNCKIRKQTHTERV